MLLIPHLLNLSHDFHAAWSANERVAAGTLTPRRPSQDGDTALHAAATSGHVEAVQLLLERGADAGAINNVRAAQGPHCVPRHAARAAACAGARASSQAQCGREGVCVRTSAR
jgi:hypothetical protein